ncbi:hypothetical protein H6790_00805 [Candidatus Nomurabacteria bacterium]|nr:hypothetical protein [Candidatus Nomurabacteria bacterium]MCB9820472.1 hypothetical protein [Candidatus Nomurabacteria bacterium]
MKTIRALFHNIRSAHNIGAMLRSADGVGIKEVYVSKIVPLPTDRFGRAQPEISKTALGAEKDIKINVYEDFSSQIKSLKEEGFKIVFVEQYPSSVKYTDIHFSKEEKILICMGEETKGFTEEEISLADVIVEIPMKGNKESLNVATTFGIISFAIRDFI